MCEAKGYICNNINNKNFDNHNQVINFRLSTFSDQNGSPIFLLLKEKKSMNKTSSGKYKFYFIGIHCHSKKLRVSSTKMNECKYTECLTNDNLGLKINSGILMDLNNNIIKLKNILMKNFSPSINNLRLEGLSVKNKDYYPLIIKFSQKIVLQGVIKKNSYLVEIFLAAERIFGKIPIRFISLLYVGQIINFDVFAFKDISELKEIFKNPNYTNSIFNFIEFEILLNFSEYGKILAEKIFEKFESNSRILINNPGENLFSCLPFSGTSKNYFINRSGMKKEICRSKLQSIQICILEEINFLSDYPFIHGSLYNSIKDTIFNNYN